MAKKGKIIIIGKYKSMPGSDAIVFSDVTPNIETLHVVS